MERTILRLLLGVILLLTGAGKLLDVSGFIEVLETYQIVSPALLGFVAVTMIIIELRIAELLLRNREVLHAAGAAVGIHILFVAVVIRTLAVGITVPNCGCFGVFMARPLTWQTLLEDIVMLLVAVRLFMLERRNTQSL